MGRRAILVSAALPRLPGRERDFDAGIEIAASVTWRHGNCRLVHVMRAGCCPRARIARGTSIATWMPSAAPRIGWPAVGATVMIEPINTRVGRAGLPAGFHRAGRSVHGARARPNIRLQYDVYHMQIMEGDLLRTIQKLLPVIGHIQIADNPGRHEPGSGEIAFERLLPGIEALGYSGHIGCEYLPAAGTVAGLGWARRWLAPGS